MPEFDWSINLGNLLTGIVALLGIILSAVRLYTKLDQCLHRIDYENRQRTERMHAENRERIRVIEGKLEDLWEWFIRGRRPSR